MNTQNINDVNVCELSERERAAFINYYNAQHGIISTARWVEEIISTILFIAIFITLLFI